MAEQAANNQQGFRAYARVLRNRDFFWLWLSQLISITGDFFNFLAVPFLLIGGDSADGDRSWPFVEAALGVYRLYGDPPCIGLYNHKQGHSVPPESERRIYEWFATYL